MTNKLRIAAFAAIATVVASALPASADPRDFHGRDYHRFSHRDLDVWRGGRWIHDWHDGRFGWWWFTGGYWYFYPQPIYPYPDYVPPAVVVQQAPPVPSGLPPAQNWYYCDNPKGYYPYVASCGTAWREVPATPAPQAPPPVPPSGPTQGRP
jgi:hypothetical protein